MQYGAMNFPVLPILEEIDMFAGLGFDYLELAMDPPMAHYSTLKSMQPVITRALKDTGLGLICHLPTFLSTADLTDSLRRASVMEARRSLELAAEMGARKVVLHPSMVSGMGAFVLDTVKDYSLDFLSEMVTAAHQLNTTICLENMFPRNLIGVEPDYFEEIFSILPSLKLTLDTGHANIDNQRESRLMRLVQQFGRKIGHLHFSDNFGKRDDHLPIGKGSIDFVELVMGLKEIGYDETLTLEVFDPDRQMLVESRDLIKAMFARAISSSCSP